MTSQWSKTAWGKAWPEVAARSVEVNPKDSMTGRYAFRLKMGVPTHVAHLVGDTGQAMTKSARKPAYIRLKM